MRKIKLFLPFAAVALSLTACNPNPYRDITFKTALEVRDGIISHALASEPPEKFSCERIKNIVNEELETSSIKEHINFSHVDLYYKYDVTDTVIDRFETIYFYYKDSKMYRLHNDNGTKSKVKVADNRIDAERIMFEEIRDTLFNFVYGTNEILSQFEVWIDEHESNVKKIKALGETDYYDELKFYAINAGALKYNWQYYLPPNENGNKEKLNEETIWSDYVIVSSTSSCTIWNDTASAKEDIQYGTKLNSCTIDEINLEDWPDAK